MTDLASTQSSCNHKPHDHHDDCCHGGGGAPDCHDLALPWWIGVCIGIVMLGNAFIARFIFDHPLYAEICAMISAILCGAPLIVIAVREIWHGHMHMDELAALGVIACFAIEDYTTAAIVAVLMLLANFIESSRAKGAYEAIEELIKLAPTQAKVKRSSGQFEEVPIAQVKLGDIVQVLPGDNFPVDGDILSGETTINEASITGESLPVEKSTEDAVFAGTINLTGAVEVKVSKLGDDTMLGAVRNLIIGASQTKVAVMKIVDKYVGWYTPIVLMICGIILFFTEDIYPAITAIVVMCPCAFLLATPTAMVAALSGAAKAGVLVKDAVDLESAANISAVVFDKTGTLTTGNLEVFRIMPQGMEAGPFLTMAASAEQSSRHPTARAIVNAAKRAKLPLDNCDDFTEAHGKGVKALYKGRPVIIGRQIWLEENGVNVPQDAQTASNEAGSSALFVAYDNKYAGCILMADKMRGEAKVAADKLREMKISQLTMLTGDRWSVAEKVAKELGFKDVEAECLPETKLRTVEKLKAEGHTVAVIGDGINDAPALAAGDISIAMGALGSDVAIHSANITFMSNDLRRLPFLVNLSRSTRRVIYQNFLVGVIFILVGTSLAIFDYMSPIYAALLHNLGSFVVIFNSARLLRVGAQDETG